MPATADDIAAASRDVVVAAWASGTIAARYPAARDGTVSPSIGYFDSASDAQAVIDARGALIGVERRRFAVSVSGVVWPGLSGGVPTDMLNDAEQAAASSFIAARIEIDLEAETTNHELFG